MAILQMEGLWSELSRTLWTGRALPPPLDPGAVTAEKIVPAVEQIVRLAHRLKVVAFGSRALSEYAGYARHSVPIEEAKRRLLRREVHELRRFFVSMTAAVEERCDGDGQPRVSSE